MKHTLIICQIKPKTKCTLASIKSLAPIFTTEHPIALAELTHKFWFSVTLNVFKLAPLLIALSSIVPFTAVLINLLKCYHYRLNNWIYHNKIPSFTALNKSIESGFKGKFKCFKSLSDFNTELIWSVKDAFSSSLKVCWPEADVMTLTAVLVKTSPNFPPWAPDRNFSTN